MIKTMNRKISLLAVALMLGTAFVSSCKDDDDDPQPTIDPVVSLAGTYEGWTWGSNAYAAYIPSEGDKLTIVSLGSDASGNSTVDLVYESETWGKTSIKAVSVTKNDTAYIFSKPITATLRQDRSAWDFSAQVDSIAMPNRNPDSSEQTVNNYPIVLTEGFMSLDLSNWQIDLKAYLVPRSEHTMNMSFRDGKIGDK